MIVKPTIRLDMQKPNNVTVYAMQNDKLSRWYRVELFVGSLAWTVPNDAEVVIRARKPDGTVCFYSVLEDGSDAYDIDGTTVEIGLAAQMMTVAGRFPVDIVFKIGDDTFLSAFSFMLDVKRASATEEEITESSDYITGLFVDISASAVTEWQESNNGAVVPTGTWLPNPPTTISANYLWSKNTITYSNGAQTVFYNVGYHGETGAGTVSSVMGVNPDGTGDVSLQALCNILFPVGFHIVTSDANFNPASLYGGQWDRIKDVMIMAAGDTYTGSGGAASVDLADIADAQAAIGFAGANKLGIYSSDNNPPSFTPTHTITATGLAVAYGSDTTRGAKLLGTIPTMPPYICRYVWERKTLATV